MKDFGLEAVSLSQLCREINCAVEPERSPVQMFSSFSLILVCNLSFQAAFMRMTTCKDPYLNKPPWHRYQSSLNHAEKYLYLCLIVFNCHHISLQNPINHFYPAYISWCVQCWHKMGFRYGPWMDLSIGSMSAHTDMWISPYLKSISCLHWQHHKITKHDAFALCLSSNFMYI